MVLVVSHVLLFIKGYIVYTVVIKAELFLPFSRQIHVLNYWYHIGFFGLGRGGCQTKNGRVVDRGGE